MTDDEAKAALAALQADVNKRQQEKMQVVGEANKKEGEAFLAANKDKRGRRHAAERSSIQDFERGHGTEAHGQ